MDKILGKIDKKVEFNLIIKTKGHWKESLTLEGFEYDFYLSFIGNEIKLV